MLQICILIIAFYMHIDTEDCTYPCNCSELADKMDLFLDDFLTLVNVLMYTLPCTN